MLWLWWYNVTQIAVGWSLVGHGVLAHNIVVLKDWHSKIAVKWSGTVRESLHFTADRPRQLFHEIFSFHDGKLEQRLIFNKQRCTLRTQHPHSDIERLFQIIVKKPWPRILTGTLITFKIIFNYGNISNNIFKQISYTLTFLLWL